MKQPQHNLAPSIKVAPALCLDLDGTVRRSKSGQSFIKNFEDIELMPGIEKLIWMYRDMGYLIFGISNQGGVAHSYKLPLEIENELDRTLALFKQNPFHVVKMCYHMEDGNTHPYCYRSMLRKPNIGMLALAEAECFKGGYVVDWDNSLFVGDRPEDEECAKNANIKFEHIDSFLSTPREFIIGGAQAQERALPIDLESAIRYYLPRFEGMEEKAMEKGEDGFAAFCHSQLSGGIGMKIRNELGLWDVPKSDLHMYFVNTHGCSHPDSMSDLIIRGVYKELIKKFA